MQDLLDRIFNAFEECPARTHQQCQGHGGDHRGVWFYTFLGVILSIVPKPTKVQGENNQSAPL